jgi:hypothetical protein
MILPQDVEDTAKPGGALTMIDALPTPPMEPGNN